MRVLIDVVERSERPRSSSFECRSGLAIRAKKPDIGRAIDHYGNHCPSLEAAGLSDLTEKLQPRHPARGT